MADTFTSRLRIRKQQTGANTNTWGGLLNSDAIELFEKAIAGMSAITVAGSDVTLTTNNGADDQARGAMLLLQGSPGAARNIIIPQKEKHYVVRNLTDATMTITTDTGGDEVDVDSGVTTFVMCDGADVIEIKSEQPDQAADSAKLGGVEAARWARLDASQDFQGGQGTVPVELSMGASVTPDLDDGNVFTGTLTANTTIGTPTGLPAAAAQLFYLHIQQAGSGGPYTLAFSAFYEFLGYPPTMPQDADASLLVQCLYLPGFGKAICTAIEEVASSVLTVSFGVNEDNIDLFRRLGSPSGVVTVNATIEAGVVIGSKSTTKAAFDTGGGFASGSVINLVNLGFIHGKGGRGGNACVSLDPDSAEPHAFALPGTGKAGGDAIRGPGTGNTLNITNTSGRIWGGGGGGGGGGSSVGGDHNVAVGGAGGGGAGYGEGGHGFYGDLDSSSASSSADASDGTVNLDGSNSGGAASNGNNTGGGNFGTGGAGGDFGSAGTAGTAAAGGDAQVGAGTAGAAGKAVAINSGTVSFVNGSGSPNVKGAVS